MKRHFLMDKTVSKCVECPCLWTASTCIFPQCNHPKFKKEGKRPLMNGGGTPPDWCPLELWEGKK